MTPDTTTDEQALRIAIAEKLGYRNVRYDWINGSDAIKDWMHDNGRGIPDYLHDPSAALLLVEFMRDNAWDFAAVRIVNSNEWKAKFEISDFLGDQIVTEIAFAPTFPLAVAKAFAAANHLTLQP